jgi:limonene-1,2-epoxide hydrolase
MNNIDSSAGLELVRHLCEQWPWLQRSDFHEMFTADCVYLNMPAPHLECIGPDQVFDLLDGFIAPWNLELNLLHIRGDNDAVLTERLERFENKADNGVAVELHVMGAFELRDGKISHWRDYFDSRESKPLADAM